jgi:hypothetical protein
MKGINQKVIGINVKLLVIHTETEKEKKKHE